MGGEWVAGTLSAKDINLTYDKIIGNTWVSAGPSWEISSGEGVIYAGNGTLVTAYKTGKGGGGEDNDSLIKGKIFSLNDRLSIISDDVLEIEIYDLSGKSVYKNTGKNLYIIGRMLNLNVGTYILRSVNKEGIEETTTFMFDGNSFMLNNSKE